MIKRIQLEWFFLRKLCLNHKDKIIKYKLFPHLSSEIMEKEDFWVRYITKELEEKSRREIPQSGISQRDLFYFLLNLKEIETRSKLHDFTQTQRTLLATDLAFETYSHKMTHDYWDENWLEYQVTLDKALEKGDFEKRPTSLNQVLSHESRIVQKGFALEFIGFSHIWW